jgi:hypothetical protein
LLRKVFEAWFHDLKHKISKIGDCFVREIISVSMMDNMLAWDCGHAWLCFDRLAMWLNCLRESYVLKESYVEKRKS